MGVKRFARSISILLTFVATLWSQTPGTERRPERKKSPISRPYACQINPNPPGKNFRIAVVYFKLADDQFELEQVTRKGWPHDQKQPKWKDLFLIDAPFDSARATKLLKKRPASLTAYYYQMSGGKLWLYGDEITYNGPALYRASDDSVKTPYAAWTETNTRIIQWFADHYDLTDLDNNQNGFVDAIILICRARTKFGFQGIARLPINEITTRSGQPQIDAASGIYQTDCYNLRETRHIVTHEIGHCLGFSSHVNGLHRWCLMSGRGHQEPHTSGVTMSAFEKNKLGWLDYETIKQTTRNIRLGNLTTENRAIRIAIEDEKDYVVIENRQYSEPFEPEPANSAELQTTLPGTGLLVYRVINSQPFLIPADGTVSPVSITRGGKQQLYYNGDPSDLFGSPGNLTVHSFHPVGMRNVLTKNPTFTIQNIRHQKKDIIFDIVFE